MIADIRRIRTLQYNGSAYGIRSSILLSLFLSCNLECKPRFLTQPGKRPEPDRSACVLGTQGELEMVLQGWEHRQASPVVA